MRWDDFGRSDNVEDNRGGGGGFGMPGGAGGLGIGAVVVLGLVGWALGIDPATEVRDTLGRPLPIAAGRPITGIFS